MFCYIMCFVQIFNLYNGGKIRKNINTVIRLKLLQCIHFYDRMDRLLSLNGEWGTFITLQKSVL